MGWRIARKLPIIVKFREVEGEEEKIKTPAGDVIAKKGKFFVMEGAKGELYPIRIDIFKETYEEIEDEDIKELVLGQQEAGDISQEGE